jgi:hypothetical protein
MARLQILGWQDKYYKDYNPAYFVSIRAKLPTSPFNKEIKAKFKDTGILNVMVRGKLVSDNFQQGVMWENTLEGSDADKRVPVLSSLLQSGLLENYTNTNAFIGKTSVNVLETLQIFRGVEPQELSLTLEFVAFDNAYLEVEAPLLALLKMCLPQLTNGFTKSAIDEITKLIKNGGDINGLNQYLGETPFEIVLDYNNKRFSSDNSFVITNISSDRDKIQVDKYGNTIRREVSLSLKSKKLIQREDIHLKII